MTARPARGTTYRVAECAECGEQIHTIRTRTDWAHNGTGDPECAPPRPPARLYVEDHAELAVTYCTAATCRDPRCANYAGGPA